MPQRYTNTLIAIQLFHCISSANTSKKTTALKRVEIGYFYVRFPLAEFVVTLSTVNTSEYNGALIAIVIMCIFPANSVLQYFVCDASQSDTDPVLHIAVCHL